MRKILLALLFIGISLFGAGYSWVLGEAGSKVESFQVMIKMDLIKEDNSTVTILDGSKFLEVKTDGNETGIGDTIEAIQPPDGKYIGVKFKVTKFKHKLKVVSAGTTYYTTKEEIASTSTWDLSTDSDDYGYTTTLAPQGGEVTTVFFPKTLIIESGSKASLIFINQYVPHRVIYETAGTVLASTWIGETSIVTTILPAIPSKSIAFDVRYSKAGETDMTNTITAFLDSKGDLIGAYMMRPEYKALNGSFLLSGTKTGNDYTFKFQNGDDSRLDGIDGNDYYNVKVALNCNNSTFSDLDINVVGGDTNADPSDDGYSLAATSGTVTCKTISIPE